MLCINCGKILNPTTLVCDACGTNYNKKPKCEHFYTEWQYSTDPIHNMAQLLLKCESCGEITKLNCSEAMLLDMIPTWKKGW